MPIYRTRFHFGRVQGQYTEQATITAFQRIFHFGRVCPIYRTSYNNSFSENISLWEGVPIYRTSYNNSFGRRIFHFRRVCQYTEQATITALGENISLWEGVPIYRTRFHFGRVCQYTEQATITAFQRIFNNNSISQLTSLPSPRPLSILALHTLPKWNILWKAVIVAYSIYWHTLPKWNSLWVTPSQSEIFCETAVIVSFSVYWHTLPKWNLVLYIGTPSQSEIFSEKLLL